MNIILNFWGVKVLEFFSSLSLFCNHSRKRSKACKGSLLNPIKGERVIKGGWSSPIEGKPLVDAGDLDGEGIRKWM